MGATLRAYLNVCALSLALTATIATSACGPVLPGHGCVDSEDCPVGTTCNTDVGVCVSGAADSATPPSADASAEGGVIDGASSDLVGRDLVSPDRDLPDVISSDVTIADAAQVDSSAHDLSSADLVVEDSTSSDLAVIDSSLIDAAASDSASTDMQIPDAGLEDAAHADSSAAYDTSPLDVQSGSDLHSPDLVSPLEDAGTPTDGGVTDAAAGSDSASLDVRPLDAGYWVPGFSHRVKIIFTHQPDVASQPLSHFPLVVRLKAGSIRSFADLGVRGNQMQFYDPDDLNTPLHHEVDSWTLGEEGLVWVQVPELIANGTDHIWLYYGASPADVSTPDPTAVWSSGFAGVWHFGEAALADSTGVTAQLLQVGTTNAEGRIGGAKEYDSAGEYECMTTLGELSPHLDLPGDLTVSLWARIDYLFSGDWQNPLLTFGHVQGAAKAYFRYGLWAHATGAPLYMYWDSGDDPEVHISPDSAVNTAIWQLYTVTRDSANKTVKFYVNGEQLGEEYRYVFDSDERDDGELWIGADYAGLSTYRLDAVLDEVRISNVPRSAPWVKASYLNGVAQLCHYLSDSLIDYQ